ncbi:WAS/WASL-interacting protein family member 3 [Aplysia californica]|uniref:WAS/WASL-interacting protein family member 3 n=1 Tax=Aplysia californica TaxID=6500 RepID=A0ABM0JI46_APLCA|nr:WAS/WASL-interacting protein family member 3 [Aplysia californica]
MREGPNGLAISKRMDARPTASLNHYMVQPRGDGYILDVVNPHKPMKSLAEVMAFFVETSGRMSTIPLITNDYSKLGIPEEDHFHDYRNFIHKVNRDVDSGELTDAPDFRESGKTLPRPTSKPVRPHFHHSQTINWPGGRYGEQNSRVGIGSDTYQGPPYNEAPPPPPFPHKQVSPQDAKRLYVNLDSSTSQSKPDINSNSKAQSEIQAAAANLRPVSASGAQIANVSKVQTRQQISQENNQSAVGQNIPSSVQSLPGQMPPPPPFPSIHSPTLPSGSSTQQKNRPLSPTPPPVPKNHPPPLRPGSDGTDQGKPTQTATTGGVKSLQQNQNTPEVAPKPTKVPNVVTAAFRDKLEQTLGGGLSSPPPTTKQAPDFSRPTQQSTANIAQGHNVFSNSPRPSEPPDSVEAADETYDNIDHYSNASMFTKSQ